MKVVYTSLVHKKQDGSARKYLIPAKALSTYTSRDIALLNMMALGGIHAAFTPEFEAYRNKMLSAKRRISRNGWYCEEV